MPFLISLPREVAMKENKETEGTIAESFSRLISITILIRLKISSNRRCIIAHLRTMKFKIIKGGSLTIGT